MIVIVEGPDSSGKSTLVEKLKRSQGVHHVSMLYGRDPGQWVACRQRTYDTLYNHGDRTIVCERFHPISDRVYRALDGKPRMFSEVEFQSIVKMLAEPKACRIIYCRPSILTARTIGLEAKGDDDPEWIRLLEEKLELVYSAYDILMTRLAVARIPVIRYDFSDIWSDLVLKEALPCAV